MKKGEWVVPEYINVEVLKKAYREMASAWKPFKPAIQVSADGEPLLHPKREELLCYPAKIGLDVGLTTNGTLLTEDLVEKMCLAGVNLINVSLDAATEKTYGIVRPVRFHNFNFFKVVCRNIQNAVKIKNMYNKLGKSKMQIMINMIQREETKNEEDAFVQLGKELGVDKVTVRPLNTSAGLTPFLEKEVAQSIVRDKWGIVRFVDGVARHPCHFPFTRFSLTINDENSVKFVYCPHAWDREEADIGVYPRDGSLKDLWEGKKLAKIRKSHLTNNFKNNSLCGACADWRLVTGKDQITYAQIVKGDFS